MRWILVMLGLLLSGCAQVQSAGGMLVTVFGGDKAMGSTLVVVTPTPTATPVQLEGANPNGNNVCAVGPHVVASYKENEMAYDMVRFESASGRVWLMCADHFDLAMELLAGSVQQAEQSGE